ncbi:hypothetical protein BGZ99_001420 [Dissophora globulifera]|uniref:Uncharacterized protein n=1 Tax=Dissophora globulifera TaxID=979702 RepID=A0A9P6UY27_9FUNG|nr:hypothetical protein BGZ99_001420 [Dissophora globulifera]
MGACCGKPDRKNPGYVLGGANNTPSNNTSATPASGAVAGKGSKQQTAQAGHTLGGSASPASPPRQQGELSASALAAQKRAEEAKMRGVQSGGGALAKKLAKQQQESPFAIEQPVPEPTNTQWN